MAIIKRVGKRKRSLSAKRPPNCKIPLSIISLVEKGNGVYICSNTIKPNHKKKIKIECLSLTKTKCSVFDKSDIVSDIIYLEQKDEETLFKGLLEEISDISFLQSPPLIRESSWDPTYLVPIDYSFNIQSVYENEDII